MYQAELHGKLPTWLLAQEDRLTSQVFSFFLYSPRAQSLAPWLRHLGLDVTDTEAATADIVFWSAFEEGTEPDLVIEVGRYFILVEAKLRSDYGIDVEDEERNQLKREVSNGRNEARKR